MRRFVVMTAAAAAAGMAIAASRMRSAPSASWRERFEFAAAGRPSGPLGWVYARVMAVGHRPVYAMLAGHLDLRPDDDVLDVGCGSAGFLKYQAAHVRHVAGLDASAIQVGMARRRLAERIAAGTAEIVMGDAAALPWETAVSASLPPSSAWSSTRIRVGRYWRCTGCSVLVAGP